MSCCHDINVVLKEEEKLLKQMYDVIVEKAYSYRPI